MKKLVWDLFKETGDIKYFLMYTRLKEEDSNENRRSGRNNSKRN